MCGPANLAHRRSRKYGRCEWQPLPFISSLGGKVASLAKSRIASRSSRESVGSATALEDSSRLSSGHTSRAHVRNRSVYTMQCNGNYSMRVGVSAITNGPARPYAHCYRNEERTRSSTFYYTAPDCNFHDPGGPITVRVARQAAIAVVAHEGAFPLPLKKGWSARWRNQACRR
jgi:hypothetical protein